MTRRGCPEADETKTRRKKEKLSSQDHSAHNVHTDRHDKPPAWRSQVIPVILFSGVIAPLIVLLKYVSETF
jgi:hypothetical protein